MTTLLSIFLIIGGAGFLFLIISLIVGDIFDALGFDFDGGNHDFGIFDSRVISVFLLSFGGFGAIAALLGLAALMSSLLGILGGIFLGFLVYLFGKTLYAQQSSSSITAQDLIGRTARVTVKIMPNQVGQISCLIGEEYLEKLARSTENEEIPVGSMVIIEDFAGDSVLVRADKGEGFLLYSEKY